VLSLVKLERGASAAVNTTTKNTNNMLLRRKYDFYPDAGIRLGDSCEMTFRPSNERGQSRTDYHAGRILIPHRAHASSKLKMVVSTYYFLVKFAS